MGRGQSTERGQGVDESRNEEGWYGVEVWEMRGNYETEIHKICTTKQWTNMHHSKQHSKCSLDVHPHSSGTWIHIVRAWSLGRGGCVRALGVWVGGVSFIGLKWHNTSTNLGWNPLRGGVRPWKGMTHERVGQTRAAHTPTHWCGQHQWAGECADPESNCGEVVVVAKQVPKFKFNISHMLQCSRLSQT